MTVFVALAAFGVCYADVFTSLVNEWSKNNLYSYGFAVPFIAAYIWWARAQASPVVEKPDYTFGVPVTLLGLAMLEAGRLSAIAAVEQASLVVTLAGLVLLLFGRQAIKSHWFAVTYLLLMIPIWNEVISRLQDPSRLLSTKLAVYFLHSVGVPALRQGTIIVLPSHALSVLKECSGVNQLVALTAMVLPAAYLWLDSNARRVALLSFAVAISYVGNGLRIALVGWLAFKGFGDGTLNGPSHLLQGLGVSALGYLAIGGCFSLLSMSKRAAAERPADAGHISSSSAPPSLSRRLSLDVAVLCVLVVVGVARLSATQLDIDLSQNLSTLDTRIGDWILELRPRVAAVPFPGIDDSLVDVGGYPTLAGERRFVAVDDELVRAYRNSAGDQVELYVGYYRRQEQGKELAGEASDALGAVASKFPLETESGTVVLNEVVRETGGNRRGLLYWYEVNGRIVPDIYRVKGYTVWDALTRGRTNGAVVMIAWQASAGPLAAAQRERALAFTRALIPVLRRRLPS